MSDRYDALLRTLGERNKQIRDLEAEQKRLRAAATHLVSGIEFDLPDDRSQIVLVGELRALRDTLDGTATGEDT